MSGIGEAASVIGIVASAVQAARVLADFAIEVRDATADAVAIGQDAQDLSNVLATLQKWLLTGAIKPAAAASLTGALNTCLSTTGQLSEIIKPYTRTVRSRSRLTWRSLKWTLNKQEVRELRERWQHSKTTLNVSLAIVNTYAIHTGNQELGAQIEAGNDAVRQDLRNLQQDMTMQKMNKIEAASVRGRRGSLFNGTDANFPLQRFLDELPPEDHPWANMSEPGDVLSMRSLSMYDTGTRSSTPEAEANVPVEQATPFPSSSNRTPVQEPQNTFADLRLTTVTSEPITLLDVRNLDAALHIAKPEDTMQADRSTTLPYRTTNRAVDTGKLDQEALSLTQEIQQSHGPLHQALDEEDTYKIMSLLTTDIDVNEVGRDKRTPLHVCALLNDTVTAQALLRTGRVDQSRCDVHGRTSFQCALEVGNDVMACLLLPYGANIEDLAAFVSDMTKRMRRPVEEKVAHSCLAWLSQRDDLDMDNRFIDALVTKSGTSHGSIARFLEGTPYLESYVKRSSVRIRSRSMDSRREIADLGSDASRSRYGVEEYFGIDTLRLKAKLPAGSSSLSPNSVIENSVLWRLTNRS